MVSGSSLYFAALSEGSNLDRDVTITELTLDTPLTKGSRVVTYDGSVVGVASKDAYYAATCDLSVSTGGECQLKGVGGPGDFGAIFDVEVAQVDDNVWVWIATEKVSEGFTISRNVHSSALLSRSL